MALKFLNKKGWHTGSLRNIENVWKAEQKHEQEQKKLEELRKQILEERERSEFRLLQEQAGLVPKQERLEFLYDSGLAVGRGAGSSDKGGAGVAFKAAEEALSSKPATTTGASASNKHAAVPGALFEDRPHSANDAWRKLHSDPLLMIRQREQEALACIKNNPVQMAIIRKSVETTEQKKTQDKKERRKKHQHSNSKCHRGSSSKHDSDSVHVATERGKRSKTEDYKSSKYNDHHRRALLNLADESSGGEHENKNKHYKTSKYREPSVNVPSDLRARRRDDHDAINRLRNSKHEEYFARKDRANIISHGAVSSSPLGTFPSGRHNKRWNVNSKLTDEERATRLWEMQMDGELHEEQRWKRLKKAEEDDSREASRAGTSGSRSFLDDAHKSVYGSGKGGSSSIEESVRRRTHYLQGRYEVGEGNAFRR